MFWLYSYCYCVRYSIKVSQVWFKSLHRIYCFALRIQCTYGRDVVGYCQLCLTIRCRHPAPGQDLIPLQRLHVFAHSMDPHPAIKLWCQVPFTKSKTIFQIEMYCMQCIWKANISKLELSTIKIGELSRKLWSLRRCILILSSGALTPQGIGGVMKRDVKKHWCTLQWCAGRGWVIAHENWTSWHVGSKPPRKAYFKFWRGWFGWYTSCLLHI